MNSTTKIFLAAQTALLICGCTSSVKTDATKLAQVKVKFGQYSPELASPEASAAGTKIDIDMGAEEVIAKECLQAWRKAIKGDEKGAISQLDELEKRYPTYSTVKFMKGQVLEQFGRGEEAIKYYRQSLDNSEFSSIRQFKLAEALRKTKKYKDAEMIYRKLLKTFTDFPDAKLGLARCLIAQDDHSKEGHQLLEETVILCEALMKTQQAGKVADAKRVLTEVLEVDPGSAGAKKLLGK
ncbi:MAG: tetratricopeptide repeat protein [Candidatus Melainabacteria bacterium]|nr:tetratricopeptide repeat protein [Candidatus Melainabacteria bacterium]